MTLLSALVDRVADVMRSSVRAGAPPFLFDKNTPLLPDLVAAAADAARAAVPADAMREMTGAVAVDLAGWMFGHWKNPVRSSLPPVIQKRLALSPSLPLP